VFLHALFWFNILWIQKALKHCLWHRACKSIRMNYFLNVALVFVFSCLNLYAQEPWTEAQLMQPLELNSILKDKKSEKPLILNIGPMGNIKSAVKIGGVTSDDGIAKLKKETLSLDEKKPIVIYCGCCTARNCPNIRPAFILLKELGFKNVKVLDIGHSLQMDWIYKDYLME